MTTQPTQPPSMTVEEALALAAEGFKTVDADDVSKVDALKHLRTWLTAEDRMAYWPQIYWLVQTKQWSGLLDRFYQILPFGTGGRRGPIGVGPNRMNLWTLGASVQGHCEYLRERFPGADPLRTVIAYDVRCFKDKGKQYSPDLSNPVMNLTSRDLAEYAARIYAAFGIHTHILPRESRRYLATPELSYTLRKLQAHGGLNVSASHNPPDDNGGKFYDEHGAQPVPPEDQIMADLVEQVETIKVLPWHDAVRAGVIHWLDDSSHRGYIELSCQQSLISPPVSGSGECKIVFTPLHGVGSMTSMEILRKCNFHVIPVESQMNPDGQFPNVTRSPNPEFPESMDRALALAREQQADLVLSTDPDADRLGAMAPDRNGVWRFINGNEIAALITHFKLRKIKEQGRLPSSPLVTTTLVTTGQISRIAHGFEVQVVDNLLVGFKYVADLLLQLEQTGAYEEVAATPNDFLIATEESHGILLTAQIRDKDAGGAALLLAELTLDQKRQKKTVIDYIDELARQYGYFHNHQIPLYVEDLEGKQKMARMMEALRADPPKQIGGLPVTHFEDLRDPEGRLGPIKGKTDAAARNVLVFGVDSRGKVTIRPSGTEPKAKVYVEVSTDPRPSSMPDAEWGTLKEQTDTLAERLGEAFVQHARALCGM